MKTVRRQKVTKAQIAMPSGTRVRVRQDDGSIVENYTRSDPWQLGHGVWVVSLFGISGGYDLERVTPIPLDPAEHAASQHTAAAAEAAAPANQAQGTSGEYCNDFDQT